MERNSKQSFAWALILCVASVGCGDETGGELEQDIDPNAAEPTTPDGQAGSDDPADGVVDVGEQSWGRLLVGNGAADATTVPVVDLDDASLAETLEVSGPSRVYASTSSRYGYAVQTSANAVDAIDPGLVFVSHLDHYHLEDGDPQVIADEVFSIRCPTPIHFVAHDEWAAAFCDGDGVAHVFSERSIGADLRMLEVPSGRSHHGVALVTLGAILVSEPDPDDETNRLPIGMRAYGLDGTPGEVFAECPGLHGEASNDESACFGCSDGVMCLSQNGDDLEATKLPNPDGTLTGVRVGRMVVAHGDGPFVGNWGPQGVAILDPSDGTFEPLSLGEDILTFAIDEKGEYLVALSAAGNLLKVHLEDREIKETLAIMPEFVVEPGHGQRRPALAVSFARAYVVDPRMPSVIEVDLATWEETGRTLALPDGGEYHSLALVAQPPEGARPGEKSKPDSNNTSQ